MAVYRRRATLFVEVTLLLLIPGVIYLGMEGPSLSRLLYGQKWTMVDPYLWPGTLFGAGTLLTLSATNILLGANHLRARTILYCLQVIIGIPALVLARMHHDLQWYAWAIAAAQMLMGVISFGFLSRLLTADWKRRVLLPPAISSLAGLAVLLACDRFIPATPALRVAISALLYGSTWALALKFLFPQALHDFLSRLPGGRKLLTWLRLHDRDKNI
jgi:O-antigen/teichoic acid export membrane protein